jgi:hypothetical protein
MRTAFMTVAAVSLLAASSIANALEPRLVVLEFFGAVY